MRLNLTPNEFADLVICFLLDKVINPDEVITDNGMFNKFIEDMSSRGIKSKLLEYYLNLSSTQRLNYKRINDVFKEDKTSAQEIRITSKKEEEKDVGIVRKSFKLIKKLLKKESISKEEYDMLNEIIK